MSNSDTRKQTWEAQQEERSRKRKDAEGAAASVTMELEVLDCPVCYGPLRPPIFQCAVGHLICSSCCDKIKKPKKCHHCSSETDYNRCHGVEKIIESIQVPCSNNKYGCSVKTSYSEREDHATKCQYAPCFCPDTGCSFSASVGLLQEHFTNEHHWPSTKCKYGWCFYVEVKEGVHVISSEDEQLFLLNIASEPFGCVISVFCVQPRDTTELKSRCAVTFSFWKNNTYHTQSSEFQVPSTTLSDGLPRDRFLFILPRFYIDEESRICVTMKKESAFQREETFTLDVPHPVFRIPSAKHNTF